MNASAPLFSLHVSLVEMQAARNSEFETYSAKSHALSDGATF